MSIALNIVEICANIGLEKNMKALDEGREKSFTKLESTAIFSAYQIQ